MEKSEKKISFSLTQIETQQFAILPELFSGEINVTVQHEVKFGVNRNENRIAVMPISKFLNKDGSPFIIIGIGCYFQIIPESWDSLLNDKNSNITLPKNAATHLTMLAIGTMRGVMFGKLENTALSQFLLPTIDVTSLIMDDIVFENV